MGLLSLTFLGEPVLAQQNQVFCRVRDGQTSTSWADVHQLTITFPTTDLGLQTKAGNYYYDTTGSLWRYWEGIQSATNLPALPRAPWTLGLPYFYSLTSTDLELWSGDTLNRDDIPTSTEAPYVGSFLHAYDSTGQAWERVDGFDIQIDGKILDGISVYAANSFWNLDEGWFENWEGGELDGDDVASTQAAPYVGSFLHGWDYTNSLWKRIRLDGNAVLEIVGNIDSDGIDTGAPVKIGYLARTSQLGAVAEDDRVNGVANANGEQVIASHTWATNSNRTEEIDPISQHYAAETIADETDYTESGPPDTLYYYVDMAGYQESGFQFELGCDAGTVTVTVECSLMDDGTAPASCTYQDVTNDVFGIIQLQAAATTASDMWIDDAGALGICKYVRVKVVSNTGDDSGDWAIYMKKMY